MDYVLIMTEYLNIKIPEEKVETLISALRKAGIRPRSRAEAVNTVIDNFVLSFKSFLEIKPKSEKSDGGQIVDVNTQQ